LPKYHFLILIAHIFLLQPHLTENEKQKIIHAALQVEAIHDPSKFSDEACTLKNIRLESIDVASKGLQSWMNVDLQEHYRRIGMGVNGIQEEVDMYCCDCEKRCDPSERTAFGIDLEAQTQMHIKHEEDFRLAKEVQSLLNYIRRGEQCKKQYCNGVIDQGQERPLLDFCSHENFKKAGLLVPEIVALRLYTTSAFMLMNNPLRDDDRQKKGAKCPLAVATYFADEGIRKHRALIANKMEPTVLWRGIRNVGGILSIL
jgi:hypothetical protein